MGPWRHVRAASPSPIRIGLICDASGQFARSGQDELRGIRLAIDEANRAGGVLGRPIEYVVADSRTEPAEGERIAERFVSREGCAILVGGVHSGVAEAITRVASRAGTIYFNTNSSAANQAGADCSRVKFVWDANGANFAKTTVRSGMRAFGRRWVVLMNDYVWGRTTAAATRAFVEAAGGELLEAFFVPVNTTDFASVLLRIQRLRPDVVATAVGGDDIKALREQVVQLGLEGRPIWMNSQQDWPDVWERPEILFGVFGTTWYHGLDLPGVADFVRLWGERAGPGGSPVPGNVSYNGFMATNHLFAAMRQTESTSNIRLIRALEELRVPARERLQHFDAWMNPRTHHLQQTVYLARRNPLPRDGMDHFEILTWSPPEEVEDAEAAAACAMQPLESLPLVEP